MGIIIIPWIIFSALAGFYASKINRNTFGYFVLSLLVSPLFVFIFLLIAGAKKEEEPQKGSFVLDNGTVEFFGKEYQEVLNDILDFYKSFHLQQDSGYTGESSVYRNEQGAYFYLRKQGDKIILQTYKLPEFTPKQDEPNVTTIQSETKKTLGHADELLKLAQLLDKGLLTKEEFETQKQKILQN